MVDSRAAECGALLVWEVSNVTVQLSFFSFLWSGSIQADIKFTLTKAADLWVAFNFQMF